MGAARNAAAPSLKYQNVTRSKLFQNLPKKPKAFYFAFILWRIYGCVQTSDEKIQIFCSNKFTSPCCIFLLISALNLQLKS